MDDDRLAARVPSYGLGSAYYQIVANCAGVAGKTCDPEEWAARQ
jgi:hypothetical protein